MSASKVYFTNFRATFTENLLQKLARLVKKAGMLEQIDFKNQYTAIKIHFGELSDCIKIFNVHSFNKIDFSVALFSDIQRINLRSDNLTMNFIGYNINITR